MGKTMAGSRLANVFNHYLYLLLKNNQGTATVTRIIFCILFNTFLGKPHYSFATLSEDLYKKGLIYFTIFVLLSHFICYPSIHPPTHPSIH